MYLHLSKKSACANALAPLYGWREGGPMQYCLIHRTTAHTSKSLLDPGKGQFVLNGNLIKSQDFSTTRAFKLCGVCIYWPLFASEGTITCLRSQKPEIELCFLNSQGKGSFQNLIAVLEKQYKWPRNWLAIKNTGHTVTFESQMNSEQKFFFFYHKYIPCSIWDILIPKKMYLKFTLIACPAFYLETLPRIELLEHKDVCNLRTTCMFCLTTSGSSIHFLKFGDWVGGGLIFFFSPYSLKMAVFYLPGLWWIFIICNNERERPWGQEMSDLAESLTSALTLASHNMLCIFRPLHCWSLLTWQLLGWMVSPWTRRATQGEAGSGCMVFGWGWARTLFPTFSSVASINFSKAPISLCFLSHPDVL